MWNIQKLSMDPSLIKNAFGTVCSKKMARAVGRNQRCRCNRIRSMQKKLDKSETDAHVFIS
jgi:hypothetical protein